MPRLATKPVRPLRRWARVGLVVWGLGFMLYLANSVRTQGVAPAQLHSDTRVQVLSSADALELRPIASLQARGLIFFSGSGVSAEAYVPLLRPVAEAGHRVFIVRLPWRFAPLESHRDEAIAQARALIASQPEATGWVAAGHSLGGAIAARWLQSPPPGVTALVLVGTTHPKDHDLSALQLPVTKVYATNDEVAPVRRVLGNRRLLPASTQWLEIKGGNHSQFGHYGHQLFDGDATITREEQQLLTRGALLQALAHIPAMPGSTTDKP
ncbi:alpha/beta fold hydrolase [Roseateles sp.]|uniref:alpha/beta fold hydrolase n=1 Tax=Roseateles sp. TaxID=1971397 RepID=UPI0039EC6044